MMLILFGRACQFLLALATVRFATTVLTPVEMGKSALILSVIAGFALVFVNPVGMFINRRLHAWEILGRLERYLRFYWLYLFAIVAVASIGIVAVRMFGILGLDISLYWLVILVGGSLLFNTLNQTYIPSLNMLGFPGWFIVLTLATQIVGLSLAVFLATRLGPRAEYWLFGMLLGQAIMAITAKTIFERKTRSLVMVDVANDLLSSVHFAALFKFAWPLSLAVGFGWLQSQGYRFVMEGTSGLAELGLFVAGYSISAGIIAAFESVLTTYFQPQFYKRINTNNPAERTAAWNAYASALFPALLITVFFIGGVSKELSHVLLGPAFQAASVFVLWGALAEAARVLAGTYSLVAHAQMKTRLLLLPNAIGASLAVGLAVVLIPSLGGTGAGVALVISSVVLVAVMNWEMRKQMAIKLPIKRLAISALGGGVLLVMAHSTQQMLAHGEGILVSLSILGVVSVIYLAVQYWLIVPMLRLASEQA